MADQTFSPDWEEAFHRANSLLAAGEFEAALAVLRAAKDSAEREHLPIQASFYAGVLGAVLVAETRDQEALSAFREAELLDPDSIHAKMAVAEHLLRMDQAAQALEMLLQTELLAERPSERHALAAAIGLAYEALGDHVSAVHAFRAATEAALVDDLHATGCDLRLVDKILEDEAMRSDAEAYLSNVETKARLEDNQGVLRTLLELRARHR